MLGEPLGRPPRVPAVGRKTHHSLYGGEGGVEEEKRWRPREDSGGGRTEPASPTSLPGILSKSLDKAFPSPPA